MRLVEKHVIGRTRRVRFVATLVSALVLAGCSGEHRRVIGPAPPSVPSLTVAELLAAPDSLRVGDTTLTIVQFYAWRGYGVYGDSTALLAGLYVDGPSPGTFPSSISDVYLWAIRDSSEVWSTRMELIGGTPGFYREYRADNGPFWPPNILIEVVIGVRTSPTQVSLVLLKGVPIHKVT